MTRFVPMRLIIALVAVTTQAVAAEAWWEKGHRIIAANAVSVLPDEMPAFFRNGKSIIVRLSIQPDMWKEFGSELRRAESPDHYLDIEYVAESPVDFEFYRDRYVAMRKIGRTMDPARVGFLPYRIIEDFQKLRGAFALYRQYPDDSSIQDEVLFYAGILSHYAGDTAQPLHLTIHYNGRVNADGDVIEAKGVHARFEGEFVRDFISGDDCQEYVQNPVAFKDLRETVRQAFQVSFSNVDRVYELEAAGRFKEPDTRTLEFGRRRLAQGSTFLASLYYTAWIESAGLELPDR